jgi:hypothetical protein
VIVIEREGQARQGKRRGERKRRNMSFLFLRKEKKDLRYVRCTYERLSNGFDTVRDVVVPIFCGHTRDFACHRIGVVGRVEAFT